MCWGDRGEEKKTPTTTTQTYVNAESVSMQKENKGERKRW